MVVQNVPYLVIQLQRALLLRVPPAAREDHRQAFFRGAGGVFEFDRLRFEQRFERLVFREEIAGKSRSHLAFGDQRQALEIKFRAR